MTGTFAGPGHVPGLRADRRAARRRAASTSSRVRDGQIVRNDAYTDNMTIAPPARRCCRPQDSAAEQRMTQRVQRAHEARAAARRRTAPEQIADGVWLVQGEPGASATSTSCATATACSCSTPARATMASAVAAAAAQLGGLTRIVLGHGHTDHRGTAPSFDVPVSATPTRSSTPRAPAAGATGTTT